MDASPENVQLERLLAQSEWLAGLARKLVSDPTLADDLVQDTWCAAAQRRPPGLRDERGWLATLLANFARQRARSERDRRRREELCARLEPVEGPDAIVERAESQRRLLEALLALDEPCRSTLLARYVEGESAERIASRTGVNPSTVRTRLARGLAELRTRLQRRDGRSWTLALAPLLSQDAPAVPAGAGASGVTWMGVWIMSTFAKIGAVAAACVVCVWLAWPTESEPSPRLADTATGEPTDPLLAPTGEPAARTAISAAARDTRPSSTATAPATPAAPVAAAAPAAVPPGTIEVLVRIGGTPLPGTQVWVAPCPNYPALAEFQQSEHPAPHGQVESTTDAGGLARFDGLAERLYLVALERSPGRTPSQRVTVSFVEPGSRCVIELGRRRVRGRVFDADGRPDRDAQVSVSLDARRGAEPASIGCVVGTDALGRYEVRDLPVGHYWVMMEPDGVFDGGGLARQKQGNVLEDRDLVIDFGDEHGSPVWRGRLRNELGDPILGSGQLALHAVPAGDYVSVPVNAEGRFEIRVPVGQWRVTARIAGAPEAGLDLGTFAVEAATSDRDLVVRGARLTGTVQDVGTGSLWDGSQRQLLVSVRPKGENYPAAIRSISVDSAGSYAIDGLPPGTWVVSTWPPTLVPPVGEGHTIEIEIRADERLVRLDLAVARKP